MKYIVAAVFTNSGIAKATGNPYSMTRAVILVPFVDVENSNYQSRGEGFNCVEMGVSPSFSTQLQNHFHSQFKGVPIQLDLNTSLDREAKNVIIGFGVEPK